MFPAVVPLRMREALELVCGTLEGTAQPGREVVDQAEGRGPRLGLVAGQYGPGRKRKAADL